MFRAKHSKNSLTMHVNALQSSETSVTIYQSTNRYTREGLKPQQHLCENLKPRPICLTSRPVKWHLYCNKHISTVSPQTPYFAHPCHCLQVFRCARGCNSTNKRLQVANLIRRTLPETFIQLNDFQKQSGNYRYHLLQHKETSLLAGRSGDQIPVEARFSTPFQTGPGAHPASWCLNIFHEEHAVSCSCRIQVSSYCHKTKIFSMDTLLISLLRTLITI